MSSVEEERSLGVEARELTKVFHDRRRGDVTAARDISFSCLHGEIFGLLGPNGAGKTTTLRMLATILEPSRGTAVVAGFDIRDDTLQVRRSIGYLSTNTGLYDRLTARETLMHFGRLHGMAKPQLEERVAQLMTTFEMTEFADVRCEKMSTGMRQKVSIARAVVHDPPVLIFDEPTLGLDILVAGALIEFVEECRRNDKCVLFSTHNMTEVERLCDRIGIIHDGTLRAVGSLDDLRRLTQRQYLEEIFRSLMGDGRGEA